MLKQINTCPQWFIDATFQITPKGFQQVLNIVVYVPHLKIYFPGCYIFMTNKTESLYNKCFEMLKAIAKDLGFELKPKFLMCDFELALRNAAKSSFPDLEIGGCYSHFVKCLYDKITKLGLRRKVFRPKSRLLVSFLQILVHCEQSKREELYEEIKKIYSDEDKAFEDFLAISMIIG